MNIENWNIEEMYGYVPKTTFYEDFSIAEKWGAAGIRDTFEMAFEGWKSSYIYLTELVMVLNWKMWRYSECDVGLCKLYYELFKKAEAYALKNLKGDELSYYYRTTD